MRRPLETLLVCSALLFAGCGDDDPAEPGRPTAETRGAADVTDPGEEPDAPALQPPPCPSDSANCAQAVGTILYVERVDPDGDGDAHFVLLSGEGITAPGISVIDVRPSLRPSPLPGPGDQIAAAGPVFRGSYGQRQIQADAVRVGR